MYDRLWNLNVVMAVERERERASISISASQHKIESIILMNSINMIVMKSPARRRRQRDVTHRGGGAIVISYGPNTLNFLLVS